MRSFIDGLAAGAVFEPETLDVMMTAFERAWHSLRVSSAPLAPDGEAESIREILAKSIVQAATEGERDAPTMCVEALLHLAKSRLGPGGDPPHWPKGASMSYADVLRRAEECTRTVAAGDQPPRRETLLFLRKLWVTLANDSQFLGEDVLNREIAEVSRFHAELITRAD